MRFTSLSLVSSLLAIAMATVANADLSGSRPAASFDLSATTFSGFGDATIGWEFTAQSDIVISDLGWIDTGNPGLGTTHEVGIFDENQVLLASTTVQAGTASTFVDGFRYEPIAPLALAAGKNYVVAGRVRGADNVGVSSFDPLPPGFTLDPEISLVGGRTNGGHHLFNYPGMFFRADRIYFGPNFQIVPAPGAVLLGFIGLGSVGWVKRRFA